MNEMNLEARKISFIQEFLKLQNEELIIELEKLLNNMKSELRQEDLIPMSMEQYEQEIDQAMEDSKKGRMISARDLKSKIQQWE